jgi:hypothetical protein
MDEKACDIEFCNDFLLRGELLFLILSVFNLFFMPYFLSLKSLVFFSMYVVCLPRI